jgi:hypothetical protein
MIQSLELCAVYVVVNGTLLDDGAPLELPEIRPMEGAEEPRRIPIPRVLTDPDSGAELPTTATEPGLLTLRTSDKSMRWSRKGRHSIIYRALSGHIGFVPVLELDVQSAYRDRIYGKCALNALEPLKTNERRRLAESPLTRAIEQWISEQVESYAREFEARDRRRYDREEKDALSRMNDALDRWKNQFLNDVLKALWGPGIGPPPPPPPLPSGKPARLHLALSHQRAGVGVSFKPSLHFFDAAGRAIRSVPYRWNTEDPNIAMVDEDLMVIDTFSYGRTLLWAETLTGHLLSNKVEIEVVYRD